MENRSQKAQESLEGCERSWLTLLRMEKRKVKKNEQYEELVLNRKVFFAGLGMFYSCRTVI